MTLELAWWMYPLALWALFCTTVVSWGAATALVEWWRTRDREWRI